MDFLGKLFGGKAPRAEPTLTISDSRAPRVSVSMAGDGFAVAGWDEYSGAVRINATDDGRELGQIEKASEAVVWCSPGHQLCYCDTGRPLTMVVLDSDSGKIVNRFTLPSEQVTHDQCREVARSRDGSVLAGIVASPKGGALAIWQRGRPESCAMIAAFGRIALAPNGRLVAVASDWGLRIHDTEGGNLVHKWDPQARIVQGHREEVGPATVEFAPDGNTFIAGAISGY